MIQIHYLLQVFEYLSVNQCEQQLIISCALNWIGKLLKIKQNYSLINQIFHKPTGILILMVHFNILYELQFSRIKSLTILFSADLGPKKPQNYSGSICLEKKLNLRRLMLESRFFNSV